MANVGGLGSLLDARERRVDFEHVCKVLGALRSEVVAINTENKGSLASVGTDGVNHSQLWAKGTNGVVNIEQREHL